VVGIDRLEMAGLAAPQVTFFQVDINAPGCFEQIQQALGGLADVVMSDMAPDTSGVGFADHCRSVELVRMAFGFAQKLLKPGGGFLAKVFEGEDLNPLVAEIKAVFGEVKRYKLETTRKGSRELYLVAHAKVKAPERG
jgi:23S rRNA (uridine2552-2'-O)-methyltransferase